MTKITKTYSIRKFITVYIAAVVVDLLVWFASSEAYRQRILAMGSSFPWHMDIAITLIDALFLFVIGASVGRMIIKRFVASQNSIGKLLALAMLVFASVYVANVLLAYAWDSIFEDYTTSDRQQAVAILGALSCFFIMVFLMDEFSAMISEKERRITNLEWQQKLEMELARQREDQILANKYSDNHFMFNSLSVLYRMIETGDKDTKTFIKDLISSARFMTTSTYDALVPLERELENVYHYLNVLNKRHGDTIKLIVEDSLNALGADVVPMSITSLVQNAVKHNAFSRENPLEIRISYDEDYIAVENRIAKRFGDIYGTGTGLDMLKRQYESFSEKPVIVINDGEKFLVKIPALIY